ncbi:hypothetical protein RAC89_21115 [Paenibacillus sp. GD4]|uniref:hypothetical protein n=1 Tax=Paenibacillus sp. GD4 TaxID=3068890 RepID=UPI002796CD38|nr:hypothetical protein [Paenibacillus sp. GD4]MDQ1912898.1 hypothetical protein [Paenibacillus sp. GD4]
MAERSIMAYFHSSSEADRAVRKLEALRATGVSVSKFGVVPGNGVGETINPLTSDFPGLPYLTLGSESTNQDARVLMAASPEASGLAAGGDYNFYRTDPSDNSLKDTLLTASVDESVYEQAVRVIQDAGGSL